MSDMHDYSRIPKHMMESLDLYVSHRIQPGGFLTALLENNLSEAVGRADHINIELIPTYCSYMYNMMPSDSWGSPELVSKYLNGGK